MENIKIVDDYKQAKLLVEQGKVNLANQITENLIFKIAHLKRNNITIVDGLPIEKWRSKLWSLLYKIDAYNKKEQPLF